MFCRSRLVCLGKAILEGGVAMRSGAVGGGCGRVMGAMGVDGVDGCGWVVGEAMGKRVLGELLSVNVIM